MPDELKNALLLLISEVRELRRFQRGNDQKSTYELDQLELLLVTSEPSVTPENTETTSNKKKGTA